MTERERREVGELNDASELGRRGRMEFVWKSLLRRLRSEWSLSLFLCALLCLAAAARAAILERWFADKATLTTATREACYAAFPAQNVVLFPSKKKVYPQLPRWHPEREVAREASPA